MATFLVIAGRNVWRNRRRSVVTVAAIAFSVAITIYSIAITDGVHDQMLRQAISFFTGYIQIHKQGYQEDPGIEKSFLITDQMIQVIGKTPGVQAWAPRLQAGALAATQTNSVGSFLTGVDPRREARVSIIPQRIIKGRYLEPDDHRACVIGSRLAENLELSIGSSLVFLTQGFDGSIGAHKYKVKGIFKTTSNDLNETFAFITLEDARELWYAHGRVNSIALMTDNPRRIPDMTAMLRAALSASGYEVLDWKELMPGLVSFVTVDSIGGYIFLALLVIVVAFGVLSSVFTSVLERTREFGVLLALGTTPGQIVVMVMLEAALLTLAGVVIGLVVGLALSYYGVYHPIELSSSMAEIYAEYGMESKLYFVIYPLRVGISVLVIVVLSLLFSYYPAWKASRLEPDRAIRNIT